jgi:neural Wiskott-Aldrich syndrome protein
MSLRTVEATLHQQIELGFSEIVLFSLPSPTATLPSTFLFAIPLTPDTPQSMQTPLSSLSHTLTATLHPTDPLSPELSKTMVVHTRRYTSHLHTIPICPETRNVDEPTRIEVQLPRTVFKVGEPVPIYVTIPPPTREVVVDQVLKLRNIKAELVRIVKVKQGMSDDESSISGTELLSEDSLFEGPFPNSVGSSSISHAVQAHASSKAPISPPLHGPSYRAIIARSGASCRFHSAKAVQLRLILHPLPQSSLLSDSQVDQSAGEHSSLDSDLECPWITQTTLLHSVSFRLNLRVSFVEMSSHSERFSTISIPLVIVPLSAPLPEVAESLEAAYQKKHDRPPARTFRLDEVDSTVPHYDEGEAGPSMLPSGNPPPFEERDAPPPFFAEREVPASTRLPTFLESENEIIVPIQSDEMPAIPLDHTASVIVGEGVQFGFPASAQFDGHSDVPPGSVTPPPTHARSAIDPTLAELVDMPPPDTETLSRALTLDEHDDAVQGQLPPPPPAMDDPSDPPPSIDSEFRSPVILQQTPSDPTSGYRPPSPPPHVASSAPSVVQSTQGQAPPPYLLPDNDRDQSHVIRPPPYVDFIPSASDGH